MMMMISKFIIVLLTFLWTTTGCQSAAATTASAIINSSSSSSAAATTTTTAAFVGILGNGRNGRLLQEASRTKQRLSVARKQHQQQQQHPRFARSSCFNIQRHRNSSSSSSNNNNIMKLNFSKQRIGGKDDENDDSSLSKSSSSSVAVVEVVGLSAQPIVWLSLYFVATTGAGLPSGPGGLIGALEGISYVIVLYFGLMGVLFRGNGTKTEKKLRSVEALSIATLLLGLLILLSLIADQGCIPNAKPILDYSNYVKVCNDVDTPGFFGG